MPPKTKTKLDVDLEVGSDPHARAISAIESKVETWAAAYRTWSKTENFHVWDVIYAFWKGMHKEGIQAERLRRGLTELMKKHFNDRRESYVSKIVGIAKSVTVADERLFAAWKKEEKGYSVIYEERCVKPKPSHTDKSVDGTLSEDEQAKINEQKDQEVAAAEGKEAPKPTTRGPKAVAGPAAEKNPGVGWAATIINDRKQWTEMLKALAENGQLTIDMIVECFEIGTRTGPPLTLRNCLEILIQKPECKSIVGPFVRSNPQMFD
jgi:hypothetical protein